MPKKPKKTEKRYEFRQALLTDFGEAETFLQKNPDSIDMPVFGDSESALHFYATENQLDIVTWLLDHGANPDGIAEDDYPLIAACQLGHLEVTRILLKAGANPNLKDYGGETALYKASGNGYLEIIQLLLDSGADPTIAEMCGELPVENALPRKAAEVRAIFEQHTD